MKLNWQVRLTSKKFWASLVALVLLLVNQVASVFGYDLTIYNDQITDIAETVLLILSLLGIIVDPTTKGLSDSDLVLSRKSDKK